MLQDLVIQLKDKRSAKRRAVAKKIRKSADPAYEDYLLEALNKELKDPRTWETQYQLIMALGECNCYRALPFLKKIARQNFDASMVKVAIGDAIIRLTITQGSHEVLNFIKARDRELFNGAIRAIAMLRVVPDSAVIESILAFATQLEKNDGIRFWVLAATPGWDNAKVMKFIDQCSDSNREDVQEAANLALKKKYKKWKPL